MRQKARRSSHYHFQGKYLCKSIAYVCYTPPFGASQSYKNFNSSSLDTVACESPRVHDCMLNHLMSRKVWFEACTKLDKEALDSHALNQEREDATSYEVFGSKKCLHQVSPPGNSGGHP
eukprot:3429349-Amphidinium_carterae.1